jgi:hypothetical protein
VLPDEPDDLPAVDSDDSNGGGWPCPVRWAGCSEPVRLRGSIAGGPA